MEVGCLIGILLFSFSTCFAIKATEHRIEEHGYPFEIHTVQTGDGYILTMYRIPPRGDRNQVRPIAFLQHGLVSSSDCWILNGPGQALGYLLADAGYDVWLGNNRGNTYSRKHATLSPMFQQFWNFEWHDIGLYDLPAMIDYVLFHTNQTSLHYVGHSQGTTAFFVLTSTITRYNDKIRSAHLLAPVAFMDHNGSPLVKLVSPFIGQPNALVELLGSTELSPNNHVLAELKAEMCKENAIAQKICSNLLFLLCGWNQESLNTSLLGDIFMTHPAGASVNQIIHYVQEFRSKEFRQFDYGYVRNRLVYNQPTPPAYDLSKVKAPTYLYYAENDYMASVLDVDKLRSKLTNVQFSYRVPHSKWNHLDHLFGINVKELVFKKVVGNLNSFERKN